VLVSERHDPSVANRIGRALLMSDDRTGSSSSPAVAMSAQRVPPHGALAIILGRCPRRWLDLSDAGEMAANRLAGTRSWPHTLAMGWWIFIGAVVLLALLGLTYRFRGAGALDRARHERVAGGAKGTENTLPPDFTNMSG
jgi:hypothetical protein